MSEIIKNPEIGLLKSNEFYLFYEMVMQSLKTDNVKDGINKSLFMLKTYLKSGNIAIYKKDKNGVYVYIMSDSQMNDTAMSLGVIVNNTKMLTEKREIFFSNMYLSEKLKNISLIHIGVQSKDDKDEYILGILNTNKEKELEPLFWERVKDTMQIILKRASSYDRNIKAITTDMLTGIDNRNSYEMRLHKIDENDPNLILGIFDMFRLKYVNDNYSHDKGDQYIKETANILNRYWPKQVIISNNNGTEEIKETGSCIYRVGGDEFVLLTNSESLEMSKVKSEFVKQEAGIINLDLGDVIPLGINIGLVKHNPGDKIKETFIRADKIMQDDKKEMYKTYQIERRR